MPAIFVADALVAKIAGMMPRYENLSALRKRLSIANVR